MSLADLVSRQVELLDEVFGSGGCEIEAEGENLARIRAEWMELLLVYDPRDQFVSSSVKALRVSDDICEDHTTDTLLRFLDREVRARRKSALDKQQVTDELELVKPLVELLKDDCRSRDAVWFAIGYCRAYTDHFSGNW